MIPFRCAYPAAGNAVAKASADAGLWVKVLGLLSANQNMRTDRRRRSCRLAVKITFSTNRYCFDSNSIFPL
jgi:hypothetical protein